MMHSTMKVYKNKFIRILFVLLFWLVLWQLLSIKIHSDIFLPGPLKVLDSLMQLITTKEFYRSVYETMWKIGVGFVLAFVTGCILGSLSYQFGFVGEILSPAISVIKSVPIASMIILILVWIHSEYLSIFIAFTVVTPMIYFSVLTGLTNMNKKLLEMAKVYRMGWLQKVRYIYLSEVLPYVSASTKTALGMCWKSGISAEIIGLPSHSIGEQLYYSKIYLNISDLFAWTIVIVALSMLCEKGFFYLLDRLMKKVVA